MNFKELIDAAKAEAIDNSLNPNEETVYRSICRSYSKKFNVALPEVYKMDAYTVLLEIYEDQMDGMDLEENPEVILEHIYQLEDPDYQSKKEDELNEFINDAELEEEERVKNGKPIHPEMRSAFDDPKPKPVEPATSGKVDFSHLKDEEG